MSLYPPSEPLIAIVGATGTGKSKLAVELAKRFNGEVINADALQMYKGLPITTNKVSEAERQNIPHWIFDQIGLEEEPWTAQIFRSETRKVIQEIRSRGRLPILVGGTHYYAEAVLFNNSSVLQAGVDNPPDNGRQQDDEDVRQRWPVLDAPTSEILARLHDVDPQMANRWHPRDRRKIQRSLEIWLKTGKTASQTYEEQRQQRVKARKGNNEDSVGNDSVSAYSSLILWLRAKADSLTTRLDNRVDAMLSSGLIQEAQAIASQERNLIASGLTPDKTKGIWTSIGYKELHPYLTAARDPETDKAVTAPDLDRIRSSCVASIKTATRQYAHRQDRWIRLHLSTSLIQAGGRRALDNLYPLDCTKTDPADWNSNVYEPSTAIISAFLAGTTRPTPDSTSEMAREIVATLHTAINKNHNNKNNDDDDADDNSDAREPRACRYCQICDKTLMTDKEWTTHQASNSHLKTLAGRRKWEKFQAWKAAREVSGELGGSDPEFARGGKEGDGAR